LSTKRYTLDGPHPTELVDDLYREYFDLHPAESTIDIALAVNTVGWRDDDEQVTSRSIEVVDVRIMRVTDPVYDTHDNTEMTPAQHRFIAVDGTPGDLMKEMVRWAKKNAEGLVWVRKVPENQFLPNEQELAWNEILSSIDFALGDPETKHRNYFLGAVVNRTRSVPLPPSNHPNSQTGDPEIDIAVTRRILNGVAKKRGFGEGSPYMVLAEKHLAALAQISGHEDEHGSPEHEAAHKVLADTAAGMGKIVAQQVLNDPNASEQEKAATRAMLQIVKLKEMLEGGLANEEKTSPYGGDPSIGFRPPKDIFALPKFTLPASDNVKKIGFTPPEPTDKDRLN
jgi:hypothetical protein